MLHILLRNGVERDRVSVICPYPVVHRLLVSLTDLYHPSLTPQADRWGETPIDAVSALTPCCTVLTLYCGYSLPPGFD